MTPEQRTPVIDKLDQIIDLLRDNTVCEALVPHGLGRVEHFGPSSLSYNRGVQPVLEIQSSGEGFSIDFIVNGGAYHKRLGFWRWKK